MRQRERKRERDLTYVERELSARIMDVLAHEHERALYLRLKYQVNDMPHLVLN